MASRVNDRWPPDPPEDQTSGLVHAARLTGAAELLFGAARTAR
jgi:hypothetical protein